MLMKASEIIVGGKINVEEAKNASEFMKGNEKVDDFLKGKIIDNYWNSVFQNCALVDEISENDEKALSNLLNVENVYDKEDH